MKPQQQSELISIAQAAHEAAISRSRIHSWIGCGKIRSELTAGRRLVDRGDLHQLLRERAARRPKPRLRLVVDNT